MDAIKISYDCGTECLCGKTQHRGLYLEECSSRGLAVTYPDTEAIFNGLSVAGVSVKDIIAVNNLKHAWQFVLDSLDCPVDYSFVCQINRLVGGDNLVYNAGFIRNVPVTIGGTTWRPEMPIESQIKADLLRIREIPDRLNGH